MIARVVSVGAHTAVGLSAEQTAFGLRAALFCPRTIGHRDVEGESLGAVLATSIPEEIVGWERLVSLALPALREATGERSSALGAPLFLAMPAPRPGLDGSDAVHVGREIAEAALAGNTEIIRFGGGNEAFGGALAAAMAYLEERPDGRAIVGAVESFHEPETYAHLDGEFRILSGRSPNGFIPGEGAAFAVLAGPDAQTDATLAEVVFAAVAEEGASFEPDGAFTDVVLRACLATGTEVVPWVLVDQRTERHRGRSWDRVSTRVAPRIHPTATETMTLAERLGDAGAASGAIMLVHATVGLSAGFAPGASAVVAMGSDLSRRASFTLTRAAPRRV
jgi:3-oxoacyl-[acyl-carrier-protein] synthase-1